MNSIDFLDAAQAALGVDSDNKLATALDVPRDRISKVRTGARKIDDVLAEKIAIALDQPVLYVMAAVQAERAKRSKYREIWRALSERVKNGQAAAWLALVAIGGLAAPYSESVRAAGQCILSKIGGRGRLSAFDSRAVTM